jgi:SAM-dependent methyltransferase
LNAHTLNKQIDKVGRGYDRVAFLYDAVVKLFFGSKLLQIQASALSKIDPVSSVLIVGGGTGAILDLLINQQHLERIFYWEASQKMLLKAQKRLPNSSNSRVTFFRDIDAAGNIEVDLILLPFVLDCYPSIGLQNLLKKCILLLRPHGNIVIVDFNLDKAFGYQKTFIKDFFIRLLTLFFYSIGAAEKPGLSNVFGITEKSLGKGEELDELYKGWIKAFRYKPSK